MKKSVKLSEIVNSSDVNNSVTIYENESYFEICSFLKEKTSRGFYKQKTVKVQSVDLDILDRFKLRTNDVINDSCPCQTFASYSEGGKNKSVFDTYFYVNLYLRASVDELLETVTTKY